MLGKHLIALLLITVYAVVGISIYADYGISWDEGFQHHYGEVVYNYVFDSDLAMLQHNSRYHGPVFQFFLYSAEIILDKSDSKDIYQLRHLLTFLFSLLGTWFFYLLLLQLRFKPFWATVGMLFLIFSPRIFAHSFYNSKDAVFMYAFVMGVYTMLRFLRKPNWKTALLHGLACGFLIDVRILGLFVPLITGLLWLVQEPKRTWLPMLLFSGATLIVGFAFWPTLWHAPLVEFQNAISKMSAYPWDDPVLFEGMFQLPQNLPWYYLPKWMWITTPIFIALMMVIGTATWLFNHRLSLSEKSIPFLWVLLPFGLILWKGATVYDGWRHVYFLYPALLILSVYGAQTIFERWVSFRSSKWIPLLFLLFPISFIIKSHPHQQVFFNPLVNTNAWQNYEMDYWGLSYRMALVRLIETAPTGVISVMAANSPGYYNIQILPIEQRVRINPTHSDSADYFISNFRFPNEHSSFTNQSGFYANPIEIIEVNGNPIVGVFRLK